MKTSFFKKIYILFTLLLLTQIVYGANSYYISTTGTVGGDGSLVNPWSVQKGMSNSVPQSGDTVWLRGGTYQGPGSIGEIDIVSPTLSGVTFRNYNGERATIQGQLYIGVSNTTVWGLEILGWSDDRNSAQTGSDPSDVPWADALFPNAINCNFNNLIIHQAVGSAIGTYGGSLGSSFNGIIAYLNGWQGPDRGHGHGAYIQDTKQFTNCVIFDNMGYGMQIYGTGITPLTNVMVIGNILFENATIADPSGGGEFVVGGGGPAGNIIINSNKVYVAPWLYSLKAALAIGAPFTSQTNYDVHLTNNYYVGFTFIKNWGNIDFIGNYFYTEHEPAIQFISDNYVYNHSLYNFANNTYNETSPSTPFQITDPDGVVNYTFAQWKSVALQDSTSTFNTVAPTVTTNFLTIDPLEVNRGYITIYNWEDLNNVPVDISPIVVNGTEYEIRYIMAPWTNPVVSGTYSGGNVSIPMTNLPMEALVGLTLQPTNTAPRFGTFLVVPKGTFPLYGSSAVVTNREWTPGSHTNRSSTPRGHTNRVYHF